jgi:hypothetical protein
VVLQSTSMLRMQGSRSDSRSENTASGCGMSSTVRTSDPILIDVTRRLEDLTTLWTLATYRPAFSIQSFGFHLIFCNTSNQQSTCLDKKVCWFLILSSQYINVKNSAVKYHLRESSNSSLISRCVARVARGGSNFSRQTSADILLHWANRETERATL